ncbi:MAG: MerR family transcriptional regulator [Candidatus Hydrogenedentota bacterium]
MTQNFYTRQDVINKTGISDRNLKFWTAEYKVPTKKSGRRTLYPKSSVLLLEIIRDLSSTNFFSMKFISQIIDSFKNNKPIEDENIKKILDTITQHKNQPTPPQKKETSEPQQSDFNVIL